MISISRTISKLAGSPIFPGGLTYVWSRTIGAWIKSHSAEELQVLARVVDWIMVGAPNSAKDGTLRYWLNFDADTGATPGRRLFEAYKGGLKLEGEGIPKTDWQELFGLLAYALARQQYSQLIPVQFGGRDVLFDTSVTHVGVPGLREEEESGPEKSWAIEAVGLGYAIGEGDSLAHTLRRHSASLAAIKKTEPYKSVLDDAVAFCERHPTLSLAKAIEIFSRERGSTEPYKNTDTLYRAFIRHRKQLKAGDDRTAS
jgi:hypothetical protein